MKFLGIDFISWNEFTSPKYYKEIITVTLFTFGFTHGPLCFYGLFFYLIYWRRYIIIGLYILWMIYDRNTPSRGGRRNMWFRKLHFTRYMADYYPSKMIKEGDLTENENYIFASMPHGSMGAHITTIFATSSPILSELFPGFEIRVATLGPIFFIPFHRDGILGAGGISCSADSMTYYLREGKNRVATVVPGGVAELLLSHPGSYKLKLKERKGFVRIALKTGSHLVPLFCFGENEIVSQIFPNPPGSLMYRIQTFVGRYMGLILFLFIPGYGRGVFQRNFGFSPRKMPLHTVVGKPIYLPHLEDPTEDQVNKYHGLFVEAVIQLFERHKHKYVQNPELARIEFV